MRTNKWVLRCFVLFILLNAGMVAAQDNLTGPYPTITSSNVAQVQEVQRLGNSALLSSTAWSPDGTQLAVGGYDGFWLYSSLDQAPEFHPLSGHTENNVTLMFAPQDDLLLVCNHREIMAYDLAQRAVRYTLEGKHLLAFNHQGDWLAYAVEDGVRIGQVDTGETVYHLSYLGLPQWPDASDTNTKAVITFAHFLPNDNRLITRWESYYSAAWEGREMHGYDEWSLAGDQPAVTAVKDLYDFVPSYPDLVAALPDGQIFAIKDGATFTAEGSMVLNPTLSYFYYDPKNFSLQDGAVAAAYTPPEAAIRLQTVGIWNIETGEPIGQIPDTGALTLSPDASRIVINTTVYEVATGEVIARLQNDNYRILPGTDRLFWLKSDNTLHLLDMDTLEDVGTLAITRSDLASYAVSPETHTLLCRTQDSRRWIRFDLANGVMLATFETSGVFTNYRAYTADYHYLVTEDRYDDTFTLWDVTSGQPVDLPPMTQIVSPVISPNGLLVLWHSEVDISEVILYDAATATPVVTFPVATTTDGTAPAPKINFSPGKTYLGIDNEQQFDVWEWETGNKVLTLDDNSYPPAFSPDDQLLVYESRDGTRVEVITVPEGNSIWTMDIDVMTYTPQFLTNTILKIDPLWEELGPPTYYDVVTGEQSQYPTPEPPAPVIVTDTLQISKYGRITDLSGQELVQLSLPRYAVHLALSRDQTRLWIEYGDGTLGLWAVVPE